MFFNKELTDFANKVLADSKNEISLDDIKNATPSILKNLMNDMGIENVNITVSTPETGNVNLKFKKGDEAPTIICDAKYNDFVEELLANTPEEYKLKKDKRPIDINEEICECKNNNNKCCKWEEDTNEAECTCDNKMNPTTTTGHNDILEEETPKMLAEDFEGMYSVLLLNACNATPEYYHAVEHICCEELFPNDMVYNDCDGFDIEDADIIVALPNVWKKVDSDTALTLEQELDNDKIIKLINPETFELEDIETFQDVEKITMTPLQENTTYGY